MRLAIISQQGGKASGAEYALLELVGRLPRTVAVSWYFFQDGEFANLIRTKGVPVEIVPLSHDALSAGRTNTSLRALLDGARVVVGLAHILSRAQPDVVLTNSMKAHVIGSIAAKIHRIRCINYVHDVVVGPTRALFRTVSRLCAKKRIACSQRVLNDVALPNTTVVYPFIDALRFTVLPLRHHARATLALPDAAIPIVAIIGRISPAKGQDRFIRIAAKVLHEIDAHFCIVGAPIFDRDPEYAAKLKSDVARRGLDSKITFLPWQKDLRNVYAAIDIACNCSIAEPFGRTSHEALASGVPIVCFDDAGICEIFEQSYGGTAVPTTDEDAFAVAILRYLRDPVLLEETGAQARRAARRADLVDAYNAFADAIQIRS